MKEVKELLKQAIEIERNTREFYKKLYDKLEDPEAKKIIKKLIKEEEDHEKLFKEMLIAVELMEEK